MPRDKRRLDDVELPATRDRIIRAIDDEIRAHLEERVAELTSRGMPEAEAFDVARQEFGDVDGARDDLLRVDEQAARTLSLVELTRDVGTDARRALRGLARRPAFTLVAVVTLALGVGANAVMFALTDRLLISGPPHVEHPEQIVRFSFNTVGAGGGRMSWVRAPQPVFDNLAARTDLFAGVAAYADRPLTMAIGERAIELNVGVVTPAYFSVLGLHASVGRLLSSDARERDDRAVVVSHALWRRQFGGAASAIGQRVRLGGEVYTVVGVAPSGFNGEGHDAFDAWIRLGNTTPTFGTAWRRAEVYTFARLRTDVPRLRAVEEAGGIYRAWRLENQSPDSTARVEFRGVIPGRDTENGGLTPSARVAVWLQAVSVLVLVIAVANVVNLLMLRAIERQRETAVCLALGITRGRLIRHLSLESILLSIAAGALAILLARWLGPALWTVVLPQWLDAGPSGRLTTVTAIVALLCAVLMTLVPAVVQRTFTGTDALRGGSRSATRARSKLGESLVVVQVALTVVLLVGAGLFVRSMQRLAAVDLGFEAEKVIGARINPGTAAGDAAARAQLFARIAESLARMPGVTSVGMGLSSPFRASLNAPFRLPGKETLPGVGENGLGFPTYFAISPDYLATIGIRVLHGRGFTSADRAGSARVMLVDETMARTFWPGEEVIGRCVQIGADSVPCTTVVGVVQDTRRGITQPRHSLRYYLPIEQGLYRTPERYFFVRTSRATTAMADAVRATVAAGAPSAPFVESFLMERLVDVYTEQWRLGTTAFVSFGVLATLIATIGLFGVVSFGVARRERELGIRRALGESRSSVLRRVILEASIRSALGLAIGGVLSYALGRRLQDLLFRPAASDMIVFALAAGVVMLATFVASAGPALRAVRADPMHALRTE